MHNKNGRDGNKKYRRHTWLFHNTLSVIKSVEHTILLLESTHLIRPLNKSIYFSSSYLNRAYLTLA